MKDLNELYDIPQEEGVLLDEDIEDEEEESSLFTIIICIILFFMGMAIANVDTEVRPPGKVF
tara:strand:- start:44 stop:229 length:186 start_codon:yes stop_codon:yes gene_type:complete